MSRILFWDYGDGGAADIAAAIAVYHGLKRPGKVLLLNEHKAGEGLESGLKLHADGLQESSGFQVREHGIEPLLRLQANQRLSAGNFRDYSYALIAEQLDVVSGFIHGKKPASGLYRLAEQIYELTITYSSEAQSLPHSEIRVAVLTQNRMLLERFFEEKDRADRSDIRSTYEILVLRDFDRRSRWTVNNIRRRYKARVPVIALDYCTAFRDAVNHRDLLGFMYYHTSEPHGRRTSGPFFSGLESLTEQIMQRTPTGRTLSAVGGEER
ncbi:hypothetical protein J41TS12_21450 [Paenibacillus antibioticophila]|uniref:Uncharacterized protein n=1 Tax=Paenibacillus antibioticophila TaxID=1274374 RepID=A0A920CHK5_9BACL|nr:hypothetical protein [Paenibacillus antibioticophila]GIO37284.1 hypothetical protein J41TS12_21450 [Paenibacillus antibioticophila]